MRFFRLSLFSAPALLVSLVVLGGSLFGQQSTRAGWTPELSMKIKNVGGVRVSPDASKVAYTVSQAVMTPDRSEYVSQIWMANTDGSTPLQLTFAEKSSENPQWSPDGTLIAFTSGRSGKNNLYVLRVVGGEAEQITDVKTGVGNFAWSPTGKLIAFLMKDMQSDDEDKSAKGKDDWRWVDENVKMNRLYVVSLEKDQNGKREPRKLRAITTSMQIWIGRLTEGQSRSLAIRCQRRIIGRPPISWLWTSRVGK